MLVIERQYLYGIPNVIPLFAYPQWNRLGYISRYLNRYWGIAWYLGINGLRGITKYWMFDRYRDIITKNDMRTSLNIVSSGFIVYRCMDHIYLQFYFYQWMFYCDRRPTRYAMTCGLSLVYLLETIEQLITVYHVQWTMCTFD